MFHKIIAAMAKQLIRQAFPLSLRYQAQYNIIYIIYFLKQTKIIY